jgi:lysozyme
MSAPVSKAVVAAAKLCIEFEGFSSRPYICPAGYPTQGYGTVYRPDGRAVKLTDPPITKEVAYAWLITELTQTYISGVLKVSPALINHPDKLGAIGSFAYNLGVARYRASTLRRKIGEKDWSAAADELLKWVRGGGKVLPGLVRRRKAERALFLSGS